MANKFNIHSEISKAETLPASFYKDREVFNDIKEKIFLKTWQWIGDEKLVPLPQSVYPFVLLDNYLTEPLLLVRNENDKINCFTNVSLHQIQKACKILLTGFYVRFLAPQVGLEPTTL